MRRGLRYVPEVSVYPSGGLNTLSPPNQKDPRFSPDCKNITIDRGVARKRRGYQPLGAAFPDPVVCVVEFEDQAAVKTLIAITTKKEYKYDSTGGVWVNITYQSAAVDVNRTGEEENVIDYTVAIGLDDTTPTPLLKKWLIFTNGIDPPRYWDGVAATFALYVPDLASFVTCRTISTFYGRLVLGNITAADTQRQLVAWSAPGSLLDFSGPNSGLATVSDSRGDIVRLQPLGDRLIIFSDNSIGMITYVGGDIIYSFEVILQETRLVSSRGIANIGPYHVFMSQEDIQMFDGSRLYSSVGGPIYRNYKEDLFVELRYRSFAFHDSAKRQIWFNIPINDSTTDLYILEYNLQDTSQSTWTKQRLYDRPICMGFFSRDETLLWESEAIAGLSWNAVDFTWDQASVRKGFPTRVFGTSNRVMMYDDTIPNDNGQIIESFWDTIDFTVPEGFESELGRWLEIEIELNGVEVDVSYSIDEGQTYSTPESVGLNSQWRRRSIYIDVVAPHLRVRLSNNCMDSMFSFRSLKVWVQPTGPS